MARAIDYAENGFELLPMEAERQSMTLKYIKEYEGTSAYFLNGDTTYLAGELFVQKDLATTLRAIAEGGDKAFYNGEIAEKMVADIQANGGYLDLESVNNYEAKESKILSGSYRGYDVNALWMPSFGAITIEMLHFLENYEAKDLSDPEWAEAFYWANTIAYRDRWRQTNDGMADMLTSKSYAQAKYDSLMGLSSREAAYIQQDEWLVADGHTTHFSVQIRTATCWP